MKQFSNIGVLIPISWDDNKWEDGESIDLERTEFEYVRDYLSLQEKINFGQKKYPVENDGSYVGYVRSLYKIQYNDEDFYWNSDKFKVVFFISPKTKTQKVIVGLYLNPQIDWDHSRKVKHDIFKTFPMGNIRAKAGDIVRFDNYLPLNKKMFPDISLELDERIYTYLSKEEILSIVEEALKLNPKQKDLKTAASKLLKELT